KRAWTMCSPRPTAACPVSRTSGCNCTRCSNASGEYRFFYRDLLEILSRSRRVRARFARILKRADDRAHAVMQGLSQAGIIRAAPAEIDAAATNLLVLATFWLNYAAI